MDALKGRQWCRPFGWVRIAQRRVARTLRTNDFAF